MFVMNFESDDVIDGNLPNPINFHVNSKGDAKATMADAENIYDTHQESMDVFLRINPKNKEKYKTYYRMMPNYSTMHAGRKAAGHSAHEGDTHTASLSFSGTMQIVVSNTGQIVSDVRGTGHCGHSFAGSASIRAGNGSMVAGNPAPYRIM
jgi:hypothetical protein